MGPRASQQGKHGAEPFRLAQLDGRSHGAWAARVGWEPAVTQGRTGPHPEETGQPGPAEKPGEAKCIARKVMQVSALRDWGAPESPKVRAAQGQAQPPRLHAIPN